MSTEGRQTRAQLRAQELSDSAETNMARQALSLLAGMEGLGLELDYKSTLQDNGDTRRLDRVTLSGSKAQKDQLRTARARLEGELGIQPYATGDSWMMYRELVEGSVPERYDRLNISGC